jgi:hypothetical protein
MPRDVTADFMYLRLHGDKELYRSGYGPQAIERWAGRIRAWSEGGEPEELPEGAVRVGPPAPRAPGGRDVYCFFDNTDVKLRAPADAQSLMRNLGQVPGTWTGEGERVPAGVSTPTARHTSAARARKAAAGTAAARLDAAPRREADAVPSAAGTAAPRRATKTRTPGDPRAATTRAAAARERSVAAQESAATGKTSVRRVTAATALDAPARARRKRSS